jgi:hypothetical protein
MLTIIKFTTAALIASSAFATSPAPAVATVADYTASAASTVTSTSAGKSGWCWGNACITGAPTDAR